MRIALEDLKLERLLVLYPGDAGYALSERVEVVPLATLATLDSAKLFGRGGRRARRARAT